VGFTVLSISLSLIAVFIPILLMGGVIGRLFREFALTLSLAILISLVVALTTTPMLCARLLKPKVEIKPNRLLERVNDAYVESLGWALRHGPALMLVLAATIGLNVFLFTEIPKGFFPEQDTGRLMGNVRADQSISFQAMEKKVREISAIIQADPAVSSIVASAGGGGGGRSQANTSMMFITLKPLAQRHLTSLQVAGRLRKKLAAIAGASTYLQVPQEIRVGGRQSNATYQYTLEGDGTDEVYGWTPKLVAALQNDPRLTDVSSDLQTKGLETELTIDRDRAAQYGINVSDIDSTLDDAFGQRDVSTVYEEQNQYRVVMEIAPRFLGSPTMLNQIWVSTAGAASGTQSTNLVTGANNAGAAAVRNAATNSIATNGSSVGSAVATSVETMVPLSNFVKYGPGLTPLAVEHSGPFVSTTITFNLAPGATMSEAQQAFAQAEASIRMPTTVVGQFTGTASLYTDLASNQPFLIAAALITVYLVLGILYESFIHPLTIISTLPSAGVGAVLALIIFNTQFSLIALIGVLLLIGIVKKNAILMIDFALSAERDEGLSTHDAILKACKLRFRPIMMTTASALFGALPLAIGFGSGGEFRQPLGISIVGGLLISQALTLYTTPIIYLYLDRFRHFLVAFWQSRANPEMAE
jgi:multidrug efflux pump